MSELAKLATESERRVAEAEQCRVGWIGNSFGVKCAYCVIVRRNSQMNSGSILSVDDGDEA